MKVTVVPICYMVGIVYDFVFAAFAIEIVLIAFLKVIHRLQLFALWM